ncbi:MAG: N-acetylmuramoyl-L-alanine amidase [Bacteroidetes bacterium]|nr:MAG: N-acetylmuramoyl-L-alanine amidase [Bacteroidota bacterium]RLD88068.1 MAG: N-acetylmuramoyl-L-alanine amidase [Bacteroidota bacterium]
MRLIIFLSGVILPFLLLSQDRMSTEEYIELYKNIAIKKMKEYGIPASITLAQGILESGSGNSKLARIANNHFGIKCHKDWHGKTFYMDDDEEHECFRKYNKAEDSYRDHSLFLTQRGRYSFLFDYDIKDYKKWAHGLKKAGYATNPKYPQLLIRIIENYELAQYDSGKAGKRKKKKENLVDLAEIAAPVTADLIKIDTTATGRQLYTNNGKKLIIAREGDNYYDIAQEFGIYSWQLYTYNDVSKKHEVRSGELVYLEKKKRKADKKFKTHIVLEGESMQMISQIYGIKLKRLYSMNNLPEGIQVSAGTKLKVR